MQKITFQKCHFSQITWRAQALSPSDKDVPIVLRASLWSQELTHRDLRISPQVVSPCSQVSATRDSPVRSSSGLTPGNFFNLISKKCILLWPIVIWKSQKTKEKMQSRTYRKQERQRGRVVTSSSVNDVGGWLLCISRFGAVPWLVSGLFTKCTNRDASLPKAEPQSCLPCGCGPRWVLLCSGLDC